MNSFAPGKILTKRLCIFLLIVFSFYGRAFCQAEQPLNDVLSQCRKAKTETEDNARIIKQYWKTTDPNFSEAMRLYNRARADFEEWIEFYTLEVGDAINNKKYKADETKLRAKIDDALNSINAFNTFYHNSGKDQLTARGGAPGIPVLADANACFQNAVGLIKLIKDSKKEKQQMLKKRTAGKIRPLSHSAFHRA